MMHLFCLVNLHWHMFAQTQLGLSAIVEKWWFIFCAIFFGSEMVSDSTSRLLMTVVFDLPPEAAFKTFQVSLISPLLSWSF